MNSTSGQRQGAGAGWGIMYFQIQNVTLECLFFSEKKTSRSNSNFLKFFKTKPMCPLSKQQNELLRDFG